MKTLITATAIAFSLSAPAFADVQNAQAFFALGNDSAAERIVGETSSGDNLAAEAMFAETNDSPAETKVLRDGNDVTRSLSSIQRFFALGNDSAAERVNY